MSLKPIQRIWMVVIAGVFLAGGMKPVEAVSDTHPKPALLKLSDLEFHTPSVAIPYFHFTLRIHLPGKTSVVLHELKAGSGGIRSYKLFAEGEMPDPDHPDRTRRLAIAPAVKSSRPEKQYRNPTLVGRLSWKNGQTYQIKVKLSTGNDKAPVLQGEATGTAPDAGGVWNTDWKHYQSIVLTETAGRTRQGEPVEAMVDKVVKLLREEAKVI